MRYTNEKITLEPVEYSRVEKAFLVIVEDLGITKFPVDCFYVARQLDVKLVRYSECFKGLDEGIAKNYKDGFSLLSNGKYYIFYNDFMMEERMRFTLWYELGHISLGHLDGTSATKDERKQQAECNHFARFALVPMAFVIMTLPQTLFDIANYFGVSLECASYVFNSYINIIVNHRKTEKRLLNSRITKLLEFDFEDTLMKRGF